MPDVAVEATLSLLAQCSVCHDSTSRALAATHEEAARFDAAHQMQASPCQGYQKASPDSPPLTTAASLSAATLTPLTLPLPLPAPPRVRHRQLAFDLGLSFVDSLSLTHTSSPPVAVSVWL